MSSTYDQFLQSLGFGRGDTLQEQDAARRRAEVEAEAEAARRKAETKRQRSAEQTDWEMEDRGLFQSGVRSEAQNKVEQDYLTDIADIERAKAQGIADIEFDTLRELTGEARQRQRDELERMMQLEQLQQEREAAAYQHDLNNLQRAVLLAKLDYQRRLIDRIAHGWGVG